MRDIHIALDMMGGDYGPRSTIPAAIKAVEDYPYLHLYLCGHSQSISLRSRPYIASSSFISAL